MTIVYLIRHGATAANREVPYRLQGAALDHPLDEVGLKQARATAEALAKAPISAVYASPLLRSRQTGEAIAIPRNLEIQIEPLLIECSVGRWEGLTWEQARIQDPTIHEQFHAHPGTVPYPDGESFLEVQNRVTPALARIVTVHPDSSIAVIGHNVTSRAYLAGLMGIPIDHARAIRQANGGVNVIQYDHGKPIVVSVNACLHLE